MTSAKCAAMQASFGPQLVTAEPHIRQAVGMGLSFQLESPCVGHFDVPNRKTAKCDASAQRSCSAEGLPAVASQWDRENSSFRHRISSVASSTSSLGFIHDLIGSLEPRSRKSQEEACSDLFFMNCFTRSTVLGGGMLKVTCTFKWVPQSRARRVFNWILAFDSTVAKYSFSVEKNQYRAYEEAGRVLVGFSEFGQFHKLVEEFGPNSEGITWEAAMHQTSLAKGHADTLASLDKETRRDTQFRKGKICLEGVKTRYPAPNIDDDW